MKRHINTTKLCFFRKATPNSPVFIKLIHNSFNIVIKTYNTTNQVPEALYRTAEAYYALGLSDQSERLYQVAQYNYPESVWTERLASLRAGPELPPEKGRFERSIDVITNLFN